MNEIIEILIILKNNTEAITLEEAIVFCKELCKTNENLFKDMSVGEAKDKLSKILN